MYRQIDRCRVCGNTRLVSILSLGKQFLTGVFPSSPDDKITCGPLELVKCHGDEACGLVQLRHSYDPSELYGENYGYRSSLNQSMVDHLDSKVRGLLARIPVSENDIVLDIGSNDGDAAFVLSGADSSSWASTPRRSNSGSFISRGIQVVTDFFSAAGFKRLFAAGEKAKIVTSIAMFYDLEFASHVRPGRRQILDDEGVWHFEQSYMPSDAQEKRLRYDLPRTSRILRFSTDKMRSWTVVA